MLEAASRVSLDLEVNIVGDGPYRRTLEAQAARIGKPVRFWGWLDRDRRTCGGCTGSRRCSSSLRARGLADGRAGGDECWTGRGGGRRGRHPGSRRRRRHPGEPKDPAGIADALVRLAENPALVQELSERARARVRDGVRLAGAGEAVRELVRRGVARGRGRTRDGPAGPRHGGAADLAPAVVPGPSRGTEKRGSGRLGLVLKIGITFAVSAYVLWQAGLADSLADAGRRRLALGRRWLRFRRSSRWSSTSSAGR